MVWLPGATLTAAGARTQAASLLQRTQAAHSCSAKQGAQSEAPSTSANTARPVRVTTETRHL